MKVSEAEKLICPFMSNAVSDTVDTFMLPTNCITSDCMAWKLTKHGLYTDADYGVRTGSEILKEDREGYCIRLKEK